MLTEYEIFITMLSIAPYFKEARYNFISNESEEHQQGDVMIYRSATTEDIPQLCMLLNQLFEQEAEFEPNRQNQTDALHKILEDSNIGEIFVAQKKDQILGMVTLLYTISTALGAKVALLEDMIINKNDRGQQIGTALLNYTLHALKTKGCKRITLLTDHDNVKAHNFYASFGFAKSKMLPFRLLL
jgi:GNAT superfamily N-acetyltransferase